MAVALNVTPRSAAAATFVAREVADLHARSTAQDRRNKSSVARPQSGSTKRSKRTMVLADVELKRVEDALLDALLDHHENRDNALDRLLDDMMRVEVKQDAASADAAADAFGAMKVQQVEELLVAAVMDNHPNRHKAIDRFFDDIEAREARARAEFDMQIDNDFDGLS